MRKNEGTRRSPRFSPALVAMVVVALAGAVSGCIDFGSTVNVNVRTVVTVHDPEPPESPVEGCPVHELDAADLGEGVIELALPAGAWTCQDRNRALAGQYQDGSTVNLEPGAHELQCFQGGCPTSVLPIDVEEVTP